MATRKKTEAPIDLSVVRAELEKLKALVVVSGLPYTHVRRIDDALEVVDMCGKNKKFRYKDASNA